MSGCNMYNIGECNHWECTEAEYKYIMDKYYTVTIHRNSPSIPVGHVSEGLVHQ